MLFKCITQLKMQYKSQHSNLTNITFCNKTMLTTWISVDSNGMKAKLCQSFQQSSIFYSGNLLKESSPPPSQYIPSVYSSRNVFLNHDELACILLNKTVTEDIVEQLLMANIEKRSSTYSFDLQKNGACGLNLSEDKNMVLSLF